MLELKDDEIEESALVDKIKDRRETEKGRRTKDEDRIHKKGIGAQMEGSTL